jgi:hypothetical protein
VRHAVVVQYGSVATITRFTTMQPRFPRRFFEWRAGPIRGVGVLAVVPRPRRGARCGHASFDTEIFIDHQDRFTQLVRV